MGRTWGFRGRQLVWEGVAFASALVWTRALYGEAAQPGNARLRQLCRGARGRWNKSDPRDTRSHTVLPPCFLPQREPMYQSARLPQQNATGCAALTTETDFLTVPEAGCLRPRGRQGQLFLRLLLGVQTATLALCPHTVAPLCVSVF